MSVEFYGVANNPKAIVIRFSEKVEGIEFFSPSDFPQQVGLMSRPAGYQVQAHVHNIFNRTISQTQEVLVVRKGSCEVLLFDDFPNEEIKIQLHAGDTILLGHGAHAVTMITDCEILEVKQGPYAGANDKTLLP
jgi:oxalate decarboxylase/phosphoglucose isomerase-like protein (cupin superfamily)